MRRPRILAARADSLGDVLVTGPAIRALAVDGAVTVLASPIGAPAARALLGVADVITTTLPWIVNDPRPVQRATIDALVDSLAQRRFDEAVIFTSFHQSPLPLALVLRMAGVGRIGAISVDYPGSLLDVRHSVDDAVHEVERARSLAAACGHPAPAGDDGALAICIESDAPRLPWHDEPFVVVHPGASVPARAWDPARARRLVELLTTSGRNVAVTGTRRERALAEFVAGRSAAAVLAGDTNFAALAALLARADVVVAGNTGPMHLAAAVGTPVVVVFAPTVPASRWHPWGVRHCLLGDQEITCAGCRARVCPVPGHPCLSSVSPEAVIAAVDELVDKQYDDLGATVGSRR
jgi:ADP-heptose:LPS heptosyltransferase